MSFSKSNSSKWKWKWHLCPPRYLLTLTQLSNSTIHPTHPLGRQIRSLNRPICLHSTPSRMSQPSIKAARERLEKDHGLVGVSVTSIKICLGIVARDPQLSSIQSAAELYDQNHHIGGSDWPGRRLSSLEWYHGVPSGDASLAAQRQTRAIIITTQQRIIITPAIGANVPVVPVSSTQENRKNGFIFSSDKECCIIDQCGCGYLQWRWRKCREWRDSG